MNVYDIPGSDLSLVYRDGVFDREILDEVIACDTYRLAAWRLKPGAAVVDIGAHIGGFSALVLARVPGARVFSVELDADNFALLKRNVGTRATAVNAACCGDKPMTGYRKGGSNSGGNRVAFEEAASLVPIPQRLTLAQVVEQAGFEHVDLLKMDCEGCEHDILRLALADGTLARVRRIAAEYHEFFGETLAGLRATLAAAGFDRVFEAPICSISGIIFATRG